MLHIFYGLEVLVRCSIQVKSSEMFVIQIIIFELLIKTSTDIFRQEAAKFPFLCVMSFFYSLQMHFSLFFKNFF